MGFYYYYTFKVALKELTPEIKLEHFYVNHLLSSFIPSIPNKKCCMSLWCLRKELHNKAISMNFFEREMLTFIYLTFLLQIFFQVMLVGNFINNI